MTSTQDMLSSGWERIVVPIELMLHTANDVPIATPLRILDNP